MKTIYAETLKLTDYLELERPYDFTERHNNLNEEAQELIFSSALWCTINCYPNSVVLLSQSKTCITKPNTSLKRHFHYG